jgi:hypothetical protein
MPAMKLGLLLSITAFSALASGCLPATEFRGEAHFPGGATACRATCQREGLQMSGFVYSGEFATSCVCRPPDAAPPAPGAAPSPQAELDVEATSANVGVELERRARAEAKQRQQRKR